jgi:nucleotide-binding universal stress UspA family protein
MIALNTILVATDFSEASQAALLYGRQFARAHGATLHVLHVVGSAAADMATSVGMGPGIGQLQMDLEDDALRRLDDLVVVDRESGTAIRTAAITSAPIAATIVEYAEAHHVDLIVLGTHGRTGFAYFFMGSVAQHVVRRAPCPVLTVRHPEREFVVPDAVPGMAVAS